jgi:hypothetical protein
MFEDPHLPLDSEQAGAFTLATFNVHRDQSIKAVSAPRGEAGAWPGTRDRALADVARIGHARAVRSWSHGQPSRTLDRSLASSSVAGGGRRRTSCGGVCGQGKDHESLFAHAVPSTRDRVENVLEQVDFVNADPQEGGRIAGDGEPSTSGMPRRTRLTRRSRWRRATGPR